MPIEIEFDDKALAGLKPGPLRQALASALRKAGSTALRDMRSEAVKRIRARKALRATLVRKSMQVSTALGSGIDGWHWTFRMTGKPVPLLAYPHRQTKRGVSVEVNRGKRTLVEHAFISRMASGHEGIFRRVGKARLPIKELLGSRPVDALLHRGEAEGVAARGEASFGATFERMFKP